MASEAEEPVGEALDPDPVASRKFPYYDGWGDSGASNEWAYASLSGSTSDEGTAKVGGGTGGPPPS